MTWSRRMFLAGASSLGAAHLAVPHVFAQTPLKKVRLAIGFLAFGRHAPFYLARERGYYRDAGLDVQFDHLGGNALAFQSLVSGGSDICISDVMQMFQLEIEGKSPPMRSLAIIHQKHPLTIFFLKSRGISEPKDLMGRTMVDSPGGMIVHFFPSFAEANGLDPNGIKYTHAAPTAKMALVLQEKADMAESYIFAVPNLKAQLQPGQELGWFMYGDYGVHAYADAIVATQAFIDKDPAAANAFAKATMRGFGAVSPKLMQVYRDSDLTLDQLMAFVITEDHARQEQVFENLSYNREPWIIRRDLTASNVEATDRRAILVGAEAYTEAGGTIIRDLFTEDRGGFYEDAALLDRLALDKLEGIAAQVQEAEGWKWVSAHIDWPHAHGLRRTYPQPVELSEADETAYDAAQEELERLSTEWEDADVDLPPEVDQRFAELEAEIERIDGKHYAYEADEIARGGVFVVLNHDGEARIERGFIRPEDEASEPEESEAEDGSTIINGVRVNADGEVMDDGEHDGDGHPTSDHRPENEDAEEDGKPLSDLLIRDLTAHRTLALRLALGEQPDMALIAVTHALAAQTFYRGGGDAHCLEIRPISASLGGHADGIEDTAAAKMLADRHAGWAADMPRDVANLWGFIAGLDHASVMALFAHCAAQTVNALRLPWEQNKRHAHATADRLATAVALDMTAHWTPTVRSYLGRVSKAHILEAVVVGVSPEAAERIKDKKKVEMAEKAEQLLAGTGWLPLPLRTEPPAWLADEQPQAPAMAEPENAGTIEDEPFPVAAE